MVAPNRTQAFPHLHYARRQTLPKVARNAAEPGHRQRPTARRAEASCAVRALTLQANAPACRLAGVASDGEVCVRYKSGGFPLYPLLA